MNYVCNGSYQSFVCLDFETTGLSAKSDEVTEIGAVKVIAGQVVEKFSTLCNPGRPIPAQVSALTGITGRMVASQPPFGEVLPLFLGFLGNLPLVAHNARFDGKFLEKELERAGRFLDNPMDDTMRVAKVKLKGFPSYKLSYLTDYFQIPLNTAHRAWCDAEATALLYLKMQTL